jgi:hypothetical protein
MRAQTRVRPYNSVPLDCNLAADYLTGKIFWLRKEIFRNNKEIFRNNLDKYIKYFI